MQFPDDLQPGDTLLYGDASLVDDAIAWKEGEPIADPASVEHVEIFAGFDANGNPQSWASRNPKHFTDGAVGLYPFRADGLRMVRRPVAARLATHGLDLAAAGEWFATVNGSPYGWGDIGASVDIKINLPGLHCSHFASAWYDAAGCPQFDTSYPRPKIVPRDFKLTLASYEIK